MNKAFLIEAVTDQCASCTKEASVFKKTFDMAGHWASSTSSSLSIRNEAQAQSIATPSGP